MQRRLQLALGLGSTPHFQLQQGHQLQTLDLVGPQVEQLAHLPLSAAAVLLVAAQLGQQQPQRPLLGLLVG